MLRKWSILKAGLFLLPTELMLYFFYNFATRMIGMRSAHKMGSRVPLFSQEPPPPTATDDVTRARGCGPARPTASGGGEAAYRVIPRPTVSKNNEHPSLSEVESLPCALRRQLPSRSLLHNILPLLSHNPKMLAPLSSSPNHLSY